MLVAKTSRQWPGDLGIAFVTHARGIATFWCLVLHDGLLRSFARELAFAQETRSLRQSLPRIARGHPGVRPFEF